MRRRHRHRLVRDEGDPRRPEGADGQGSGRRTAWGARPRDAGVRLAVPAGIVTHTGLAGLTLGGGIGWLMRKYGLTIDQLLSVELVTADGELVKASETEKPDLFSGIRRAGSNFGIVTEFQMRLNPVWTTHLVGPMLWT